MLYDRRVHGKMYQVGDMVLLHSCVIPRGKSKKLHNPCTGPFRVEEILDESVYKIRNPIGGKPKIIHFDRLKPFPSSTDVLDIRQTDENTPTIVSTTPCIEAPASYRLRDETAGQFWRCNQCMVRLKTRTRNYLQ